MAVWASDDRAEAASLLVLVLAPRLAMGMPS